MASAKEQLANARHWLETFLDEDRNSFAFHKIFAYLREHREDDNVRYNHGKKFRVQQDVFDFGAETVTLERLYEGIVTLLMMKGYQKFRGSHDALTFKRATSLLSKLVSTSSTAIPTESDATLKTNLQFYLNDTHHNMNEMPSSLVFEFDAEMSILRISMICLDLAQCGHDIPLYTVNEDILKRVLRPLREAKKTHSKIVNVKPDSATAGELELSNDDPQSRTRAHTARTIEEIQRGLQSMTFDYKMLHQRMLERAMMAELSSTYMETTLSVPHHSNPASPQPAPSKGRHELGLEDLVLDYCNRYSFAYIGMDMVTLQESIFVYAVVDEPGLIWPYPIDSAYFNNFPVKTFVWSSLPYELLHPAIPVNDWELVDVMYRFQQLLLQPNVIMCFPSNRRLKNFSVEECRCIVVVVWQKGILPRGGERLPSQIGKISIDVVEGPPLGEQRELFFPPTAKLLRAEHSQLACGVFTIYHHSQIQQFGGTLGSFVKAADGSVLALTCAHNRENNSVFQGDADDPATSRLIAQAPYPSPCNLVLGVDSNNIFVDAATFRAAGDYMNNYPSYLTAAHWARVGYEAGLPVLDWSYILPRDKITHGLTVYKVGARTGITKGYIFMPDAIGQKIISVASHSIFLGNGQQIIKGNMLIATDNESMPFSYSGDSGSLVVWINDQTNRAHPIGLLHCGTASNTTWSGLGRTHVSLATPIQTVLDALQVGAL